MIIRMIWLYFSWIIISGLVFGRVVWMISLGDWCVYVWCGWHLWVIGKGTSGVDGCLGDLPAWCGWLSLGDLPAWRERLSLGDWCGWLGDCLVYLIVTWWPLWRIVSDVADCGWLPGVDDWVSVGDCLVWVIVSGWQPGVDDCLWVTAWCGWLVSHQLLSIVPRTDTAEGRRCQTEIDNVLFFTSFKQCSFLYQL